MIEKEALAIHWAVDHFKYYLWKWQCTVVTDHAPFQWLNQMKDTAPRLMRWDLAMLMQTSFPDRLPGMLWTSRPVWRGAPVSLARVPQTPGASPDQPPPYKPWPALEPGHSSQKKRPKQGLHSYPMTSCYTSSSGGSEGSLWADPEKPCARGGITPSPNQNTWGKGVGQARPGVRIV